MVRDDEGEISRIKEYISDSDVNELASKYVHDESIVRLIYWFREYRLALREIANLEFKPNDYFVNGKWVAMIAWNALKWIDGRVRGLIVP